MSTRPRWYWPALIMMVLIGDLAMFEHDQQLDLAELVLSGLTWAAICGLVMFFLQAFIGGE